MSTSIVRISGLPGRPVVGIPVASRDDTGGWDLARAALSASASVRMLDLATLSATGDVVHDNSGRVDITHLAPGPVRGHETALPALIALERYSATLNPLATVLASSEPAGVVQRIARAGVPHPDTELVTSDDLDRALRLGFPVIVKRALHRQVSGMAGTRAQSARRATSPEQLALKVNELLSGSASAVIVQQEVTEALGAVTRALVADGVVLAAVRRVAVGDEWRASLLAGVEQAQVSLDPAQELVCAFAVAALGLRYASVDFLSSSRGPLVIGVEPVPALGQLQASVEDPLAVRVLGALLGARVSSE